MEIEFTKQPYIEDVGPLKMYVYSVFCSKLNHSIDTLLAYCWLLTHYLCLNTSFVSFASVYIWFQANEILIGCMNSDEILTLIYLQKKHKILCAF